MRKRKFQSFERFAIWECHLKRCWMCKRPVRLFEMEIDHVVPESLQDRPAELADVLARLGLPADFDLNGYANLLPSCVKCNGDKKARTFEPNFELTLALDTLAAKSDWVRKTAERTRRDVPADRILNAIVQALEARTLSLRDIDKLLIDIIKMPDQVGVPEDTLVLDDGYLYRRSKIASEGFCRCGQVACTGEESTIYCYFHDDLSSWVIDSGLYHRCYDEILSCPRCGREHPRGHVGRLGMCDRPFDDQSARRDSPREPPAPDRRD